MSIRHRKYFKISWLVIVLANVVVPLSARRISVKVDKKALDEQAKIQTSQERGEEESQCINLIGDKARMALRLYGYDKPHNAIKESVFASNLLSTDTIDSVQFEVDYFTLDDVKLHTRLVKLQVSIPPGESRRLLYPSWDATRTFYYFRTPPGRKVGLSPYKVSMTPHIISVRGAECVSDTLNQDLR